MEEEKAKLSPEEMLQRVLDLVPEDAEHKFSLHGVASASYSRMYQFTISLVLVKSFNKSGILNEIGKTDM